MIDDLGAALRLIRQVNADEDLIKELQERLKKNYDVLVLLCPHDEAVDRKSSQRGIGTARRCKICGITDYASEGGTPGDEYDYGYPGYPSTSFWAKSDVEVVSDKEFDKYDRTHDWVVKNGLAKKRFE